MLGITSPRLYRIAAGTFVSAIALTLAACGGGGGGASFVDSTPTPPPAPPPAPPPPPPPAFQISAPAKAVIAPGAGPVVATAGGPNFTTGPTDGTTFPLLQTALILDDSSIRPDPAVPPATATAVAGAAGLSININGTNVRSFANPNLDWMRAGWWATRVEPGPWDYGGPVDYRAAFVTGYETPAGAMPTTGTAAYQGFVMGSMFSPSNQDPNGLPCRCIEVSLGGTATFSADFGARSLSGSLTDMAILGWDDVIGPWNDVAFSATIAGNGFGGSTRVTTAPPGTMGLNATGTLEGRFFGPTAQEAGAVWTLFDGTNAAIGTFGGRRGP